MPTLSVDPPSKLPDVGTTIFTVMTELAATHGAINLSQGYPDFPPPAPLLDRLAVHSAAGRHQYVHMVGLPGLRAQISRKVATLYGADVDPDSEITVTSGATEALFSAIQAVVHPGDEVLCLDPAYDSYDPAIRLAGGRPVHVPLSWPDFAPDWERIRAAVTPRTRLLIVNSPHNPTGTVLSASDLDALESLVAGNALLILSDEVYEHIIFDGRRHESLLRRPALAERSLVVFSFGKTYHATGWKVGYCIAPEALSREFRRVHQFVQFCVATPLQWALMDMLADHPEHHLGLGNFYAAKRDHFNQLLAGSRFHLVPSAGTYFQLLDYSGLSDEPDTVFAERLTRECRVACIPVSAFCAAPLPGRRLRFCFAKDAGTLEQAAERLRRL